MLRAVVARGKTERTQPSTSVEHNLAYNKVIEFGEPPKRAPIARKLPRKQEARTIY
jgi:hypothetical protein